MFKRIFAGTVLMAVASVASAATYNINLVVELTDQNSDNPYLFRQDIPIYLPQVQAGDVVNTNITFANGQGLKIEQTSLPLYDPEFDLFPPTEEQRLAIFHKPAPGVATGTPANIRAETSTELIGLIGDFEQVNPYLDTLQCTYCIYAGIEYEDLTDSAFTFYGISTTSIIDLYDPVGVNFDMSQLTISFSDYNQNHEISIISSVPIPAAAYLFGSGLIGLIGFARRNR